jgi:N-acetyl-anhydromuramyl-L-alanine amidase AmpD
MDIKEVFQQITSRDKWYAGIPVGVGYMTAQHASMIEKRFKAGTLKASTLQSVFAHYGYKIEQIAVTV